METFPKISPPSTENGRDGSTSKRHRREFLLGLGAATALAGCLSASGDGTENQTTDETESETATPGPDSGDDGTDDGLSSAEASSLLSPESLAFRYMPLTHRPFGELWVAVVGETDAAAVRAETASGNYNEVTPQDGTIDGYLGVPVQVDTDGDEVTVFAIDDDGASGRVTGVTVPTDDLTSKEARQAVPSEALSFAYEPPGSGEYGSLIVEVTADTDAGALVARSVNGPGVFDDRVGDFTDGEPVEVGTTLDVAVDPTGDEVIVSATVDGATGEVARWQGPSDS